MRSRRCAGLIRLPQWLSFVFAMIILDVSRQSADANLLCHTKVLPQVFDILDLPLQLLITHSWLSKVNLPGVNVLGKDF